MTRTFKISGIVEKKSRLDIFGFFSKETVVDEAARPELAREAAAKWAQAHGLKNPVVKKYYMENTKFVVELEVE